MNTYIIENKRPTLCHLLFYFTSYVLNMFRTLIYPLSGAYNHSVELPHWSCVLGSMYASVSLWLGWRGICVAGWSFVFNYYNDAQSNKYKTYIIVHTDCLF